MLLTNAKDLKAKNIMLACSDPTVFEDWEKAELYDPSPSKIDGDSVVYKSREFNPRQYMRGIGRCTIADLGMACIGKTHEGFIQPDVYRAPEVMLCMPWNSAADIWNVGVMVCTANLQFARRTLMLNRRSQIWDLFEGEHMFHPEGSDRKLSDARMLAEIIALLGPPPRDFLQRADETLAYWNHDGTSR
jgi:serine/threonine-protein kinase SRPK3